MGCSNFDMLLGGGIEKGSVTLIYGEAGAGKTNVCLQLARNVATNGDKVAYIDSEGLSSERLSQVFKGREDAIKNLLVFEVHSFSEQSDRIDKIEKLASTGTISLVIIDSLTMFYRLNHEDSYVRNDFIRQTEALLGMARKYDIAVLATSQVYSNMNGGVEFLGGHALHHNAKTIIRLDKGYEGRRAAVIMKHRSLPEGRSAPYRITETGIEDIRSGFPVYGEFRQGDHESLVLALRQEIDPGNRGFYLFLGKIHGIFYGSRVFHYLPGAGAFGVGGAGFAEDPPEFLQSLRIPDGSDGVGHHAGAFAFADVVSD